MNATIQHEGPQKRIALIISLAAHGGLLALLFILKIVTPIPPFEIAPVNMELGIADEGYSFEGMGDDGPGSGAAAAASSPDQPQESNENLVTEDDGEPIDAPPHRPDKPTTETPAVRPTNKPPKISEPTVNPNALFNPSTTPGTGPDGDDEEGDGPGNKPGNVGVPGGMRGGTGWSLRGTRGATRGPDLSERPSIRNETWVEVAIVIDRNGRVLRTSISNAAIQDVTIHEVAKRAVSRMQFVADPNSPQEQVQYVRITLKPG